MQYKTTLILFYVKGFLKLPAALPVLIFFNLSRLFSQHFLQKLVIAREK